MIASGHNWIACLIDIAECIPKALASYEAVATTPLFSGRPPTTTGLFRSSGFKICSTEA